MHQGLPGLTLVDHFKLISDLTSLGVWVKIEYKITKLVNVGPQKLPQKVVQKIVANLCLQIVDFRNRW